MNSPPKNDLQFLRASSPLSSLNENFIEGLYETWLTNPAAVDSSWRVYFDALQAEPLEPPRDNRREVELAHKQAAVFRLIDAYRSLGVRVADLDPLNRYPKPDVPELDPAYHGLHASDLDVVFEADPLADAAGDVPRMTLREILSRLRDAYCGSAGAEYMHVSDPVQKRWIRQRFEGAHDAAGHDAATQRHILKQLTAAETLERYLHTRYVGQKRFSLEGGETMIPLLAHLLQRAGAQGVQEAVIGMAHRGRLNVLVNILGKQPAMLFAEFEGTHAGQLTSGDVKYHQGFSADVQTSGGTLHVALAFNPSHLEIVDPVVQGSVRARQHRLDDADGGKVLPVLVHGDAAFAGQGVVMETLAMSQTRGFFTGGTVHVVINNQIGFTTSDVRDARSSLYCTDVAKMVEAPIFHVNADDPDAALNIIAMALDYRMTFRKDVVVDLVCYRKLGHNEQDEPLVTQPEMYRHVREHPGTRALYAERLQSAGVIASGEAEAMIADYRQGMSEGRNPVQPATEGVRAGLVPDWKRFKKLAHWDIAADTAVPLSRLRELARVLTTALPDFTLHDRVQKILADRAAMARGELPLDWGMAENLAYATLLADGYSVRLSGQDSQRGTFFHRHATWFDQNRGGTYTPLQHLTPDQADFTVIDSLLSEEAVLGFEYGYATADPDSLVLWEAQFGDFANGAQVVIDQFIASGEAKWGRLCGLVMLLPHGYEGQGAEHSSGRIERYLQLCADYNIQVCVPSTAAQMFHLLRRQMVRPQRKPLIVFTPKSLLRSKEASSSLEALAAGRFQPVIAEAETLDAEKVRRVIACSGKIYYELLAARRTREIADMAIIRIEQLYPFPHDDFAAQIAAFPSAKEVVWCQEEPGNQGAWHRIQHYLLRHLRADMRLDYALRPSSASPAAGYLAVHHEQQKAVIAAAFRADLDDKPNPGALHE
ncbi:MAG: 2-oxoglutarate dehydrogenase E1 component [Gallionellaceae bacterium]|jgi:2-oxoglutarate dehydrogenase E1 component|nr:2-oxoglutarate dehydrogenase E1 component [Gallionellaceae bacterium]